MSVHEKSAWWALGAGLLIWGYLALRMTDGWQVVELPPRVAITTYVTVVVMAIVAASAPALLWAADGEDSAMDERDRAIDATGERWEGWVVVAAVNVIVIQALASAAYPDRLPSITLPDFHSVTTLVFLLISALFAANVAKQLVVIWHYRR